MEDNCIRAQKLSGFNSYREGREYNSFAMLAVGNLE
jgi:hypothetical protein